MKRKRRERGITRRKASKEREWIKKGMTEEGRIEVRKREEREGKKSEG